MATKTKTRPIRDVMTPDPLTLETTATVIEAAKAMKVAEVGPIPVVDAGGRVCAIVTDRDIVVRALAEDMDPRTTKLGDIATGPPVAVSPDDSIQHAVELMREQAIRRLPVIEGGRAVGIVSLGDLARVADGESALADISAAPAND